MSVIRVNFLDEFDYGDDAVLVTMDGAGVEVLRATVIEAISRGSARLEHDGVTHLFRIEPGTADIELTPTRVLWRLDIEKAREMRDCLEVSSGKGGAGHHYVDIATPALTLVMSRDEYVDVVYPWIDPPSVAGTASTTL